MLLCCIVSYNSLIENPQCFETETKNLAVGEFTITAATAPGLMPRMKNIIFHIFCKDLSEFAKVPEGVSFLGGCWGSWNVPVRAGAATWGRTLEQRGG